MKRLLPLFLLLALGGGFLLWWKFRPTPQGQATDEREMATQRLGEFLAETFPGQRALVVSNPFARERGGAILAHEAAGLRGLRRGLGKQIQITAVVYPELRPEAAANPSAVETLPGTTTPLSFLMAEGAFDQLAAQHGDCELIVSLVGLPQDISREAVWQGAEPPRLALLLPDLRVTGGPDDVRAAMQRGKLAGFVGHKPQRIPPDPDQTQSVFDRKYLLVTTNNVGELLERYPRLFEPLRVENP